MRRHLLKAILLGPFLFLPVWLAATAFDHLSQREVTYRYIFDALDPISVTPTNVDWREADTALNRPVTPADKERVGLALTEAWQTLAAAQSSGRTDILTDRFTGVALQRALASTADSTENGGRISVLKQSVKPLFFHKDGSILQIELEMLTSRYVMGDEGLPFHQVTRDTGVAILMNQTSGWRIFSYERRSANPVGKGRVNWDGPKLYGVNYYPVESPWRAFWENLDSETLATDFDRVRNLGGNTIRVFLTYQEFADPEVAEANLAKLQELLTMAEDKGVWVIPTLFDLKQRYSPGSWATDYLYLQNVLSVLDESDSVAFVDLKNEADLDFVAHDESEIRAWLRTMIAAIRELSPNTAITVGWSTPEAAGNLTDVLDVVTYHEFGGRSASEAGLRRARSVAEGLPVIVTEVGTSSFELAMGFPGSESGQAKLLRDRLNALEPAEGVLVWTLYDFPEVDSSVIGASPWRRKLQSAYGLFKSDGFEKPAARAVRQAFTSLQSD